MAAPALIAHIVFSFDIGGLENGVVNLINHSNSRQFRHVIICLTQYNQDFFNKITHTDVQIFALDKKPGHDFPLFFRLYKLLKQVKPDIVHTRNMATLECQLPAFIAGVKARIHGEHGWDMADLSGANKKYQILRKLFVPLVKQYIALSKEGYNYLHDTIGIEKNKINHIYNGVDISRFYRDTAMLSHDHVLAQQNLLPENFIHDEVLVFATVGRMAEVKNQLFLLRAFLELLLKYPQLRDRIRLLVVGDGILMKPAVKLIDDFCQQQQCTNEWIFLNGESHHVDAMMRLMDVFILPSLAEGISNTILEAMASSLPVIATDVGGNAELVNENETGFIIPVNDVSVLSASMKKYIDDPLLIEQHGRAGRKRIENCFSLTAMVSHYETIYQKVLN